MSRNYFADRNWREFMLQGENNFELRPHDSSDSLQLRLLALSLPLSVSLFCFCFAVAGVTTKACQRTFITINTGLQLHPGLPSGSVAQLNCLCHCHCHSHSRSRSRSRSHCTQSTREQESSVKRWQAFRISISVYLWFPVQFSVLTRIIEQRGCGKRESCALHKFKSRFPLRYSMLRLWLLQLHVATRA